MGTRYGILILTRMGFGDHLGLESCLAVMQQKMILTVSTMGLERIIEGISMVHMHDSYNLYIM